MAKTGQMSLQFVAGHYLQKEKVKYSTYPISAKEEFDVDIDFPFDYFGILCDINGYSKPTVTDHLGNSCGQPSAVCDDMITGIARM